MISVSNQRRFIFVTTILVSMIVAASCTQSSSEGTNTPSPGYRRIQFADNNDDGIPDGWDMPSGYAGDIYQVGIEDEAGRNGVGVLHIKNNVDTPENPIFLSRDIPKTEYLGERVRMTVSVKSEDVAEQAFFYFHVFGVGRNNVLAHDSTSAFRPVIGSNDRQTYALVLDVPETGVSHLSLGLGLAGAGEIWVDDIQIDIVDKSIPVTDLNAYVPEAVNLDFESGTTEQVDGWKSLGSHSWNYVMGIDENEAYERTRSGTIKANGNVEAYGYGLFMQNVAIGSLGPSIRLSAMIKTQDVDGAASMSMQLVGQRQPILDDMSNRPITGSTDWQLYEIVLDVDEQTEKIFVAFKLQGGGQMWIDDVRLETVDNETEVSSAISKQQQVWQEMIDIVEANYVYADYNDADWESLKAAAQTRIDEGVSDEAFWSVLSDMIDALGDDHSRFLSPSQVIEEKTLSMSSPNYSGVGMIGAPLPDKGYVVVQYVFPDGPAHQAGIRAHDHILAADSMAVCCDESGNMRNIVRGEAGTAVNLTVQTPGEEPRILTVTRAQIQESSSLPTRHLDGDVGYVLIPTLWDAQVDEKFEYAWQELHADGAMEALIIDLRINDGGYHTALNALLSLFVDGDSGVYQARNNSRPLFITGRDVYNTQTIPFVVLVSEFTNSNAEVLAGILQEKRRATIIGNATAGNVESVTPFDFSDGSRLWIATETFVPPSGSNWEETGIVPDIEINQLWDEFAGDADDQALNAALSWLAEQ